MPESKDNELVGMILGMDQQEIDNEGLPHGFGGHLHQYSNSELPYIKSGQWNDGSEDFSNPFYDPIYESTEAIKRLNDPIKTLEQIKIFNVPTSEPIENLKYRQKPEISSTIGNGKLAREEWWNKYGDDVNNAFKAGELGLKWTGDIINNGFNRVNQASARTYDTMVNPVMNQTFGIGDNAYRAS